MEEIRCLFCNKLLCRAEGTFKMEIKCNKCKKINTITECQKEHQTKK